MIKTRFFVKERFSKLAITSCLILSGSLANAQFPAPYCGPLTFTTGVEPISLVNFAGINNTSSASVGGTAHEDYTATSGTVYLGLPNTITLKGNTDGNFTDYFRVYIDWNQDGDFTDAGESYDIGSITASTGTDAIEIVGTITPPANATLGNTRMRVMKRFNAYPTGPCQTGSGYGQAEDYTLSVNTPPCTQPVATYTAVPDCSNNQFSVSVNISNLGSASSVAIKEGTTTYVASATTGTYVVGPFTSATGHVLTLEHNVNTLCNVTSPNLLYNCLSSNDECSFATPITSSATYSPVAGSTQNATPSMPAVVAACVDVESGNDVWYSFVATAPTTMVTMKNLVATNPAAIIYEAGIIVYSGTCTGLTSLGCSFMYYYDEYVEQPIVLTGLTVGQTYYVRIWSDFATDDENTFDVIPSDYTFDVSVTPLPTPPNDECLTAIPINGTSGVVTGYNVGATQSQLPTANCNSTSATQSSDVWYSVTADMTGDININIGQNSLDAVTDVFSGSCGNFTSIDCEDGSSITFAAIAGQTYFIRVDGWNNSQGVFTIQLTGTALPVTMDKLSGKLTSGNIAQLSWNTFSEQNNKGFEIQRSSDGKTFKSAGFVSSKANAGNSSNQIGYGFTDREAVSGAVYYRLQQTDIDGKTAYSNIVRLASKENGGFDVVVAPNPVKNSLTVNTFGVQGKDAKVYLADITGKVVKTIAVTGAETVIDMTTLPQGMYLVKYLDAEHNQTIKVSKQ